jgi:hypothetical protein
MRTLQNFLATTRDNSMRPRRIFSRPLVLTAFLALAAPLYVMASDAQDKKAQDNQTTTPTKDNKAPMNTFVIIFRQEKPLSKSDLQERSEATRPWAKQLNDAGHNLSPRFLAPESHWSAADGRTGTKAPGESAPITALLFLAANDLAQAVEIAKSHPAVQYGASVEVRLWAATPPPPQL